MWNKIKSAAKNAVTKVKNAIVTIVASAACWIKDTINKFQNITENQRRAAEAYERAAEVFKSTVDKLCSVFNFGNQRQTA